MGKLKIAIFLITVTVFCFLPQFSFAYLDEFDFDSWNVGTELNFSPFASGSGKCKVSDTYYTSSPKSAYCADTNYQFTLYYYAINANNMDQIEFKIKLNEGCPPHNIEDQPTMWLGQYYGGNPAGWGSAFVIRDDCKLTVRQDGLVDNYPVLHTLLLNQWYKLKIKPHSTDNSTYYAVYSYSTSTGESVLIDDTLYLDQNVSWGSSKMTQFKYTNHNATSSVDDLWFGIAGEEYEYETYADPIGTQFNDLKIAWWTTTASGTATYINNLGTELTGTIGTLDATSTTVRINMTDSASYSWITNATSSLNDYTYLAPSEYGGLGKYFRMVFSPDSLMAPLGKFTYHFNFCDTNGANCGATTTYYINITENFTEIYPEKTYETWKAEQDAADVGWYESEIWNVGLRFINWLGIPARINDTWDMIKTKFPFSWFFGVIDLWKAKETEYHDTGEEPFKITLTMPTSTVVMAGTSFDVIDFEGAVRDYGGIISMFRNVFVYVIWLGLIMTVYKKTKVFVKQLQEED